MTIENIELVLKMRMAVYKTGISKGMWKNIETVSDTMDYIFPKTGHLAFYNLLLEQMRYEHSMIIGGFYNLFKMPAQVEKEIHGYLKKKNSQYLHSLVEEPEAFLKEQDTIVTDHYFDVINIGSFKNRPIETILRLIASHYRYSFENNLKSFPYLE